MGIRDYRLVQPRVPRVLVVEDNADVLGLLGKLLSGIPVDLIAAQSCLAARQGADTLGGVDILITNVRLDDGDGLDVARDLRAAHGCFVVVMSGMDPPIDGLPKGVDLWLVKPVGLLELRRMIKLCSGGGAHEKGTDG